MSQRSGSIKYRLNHRQRGCADDSTEQPRPHLFGGDVADADHFIARRLAADDLDLGLIENQSWLATFCLVAQFLEVGPMSFRALSKKFQELKKRGMLPTGVHAHPRTIESHIEKLERRLGELRGGNPVRLTTRDSTRKGGLTPEGRKLLPNIRKHLQL